MDELQTVGAICIRGTDRKIVKTVDIRKPVKDKERDQAIFDKFGEYLFDKLKEGKGETEWKT